MAAGTDMMIVGSTNKPEVLDSAILRPGRFDKIIYVPPPNERERKEILKIHLKGKPAKGANISRLARSTEGFSGADIANMVNEAAIIAMKSALKSGEEGEITLEHFNEVLRSIKPSITDSMLQDYENYKARFERKLLRVTEEDKMGEGAKA
jgi:transitional endoplasmic reticulum ATPase